MAIGARGREVLGSGGIEREREKGRVSGLSTEGVGFKSSPVMLIFGTANPVGYGGDDYHGLYLTDRDIDENVPKMYGIPVKIEHRGEDIGKVVSAWKHSSGRMDLVLEIDGISLESEFGREFVKRGVCKDLSLGYNVQMSKSESGMIRADKKKVVEVSLVRVGARDDCHIRGWSSPSQAPPGTQQAQPSQYLKQDQRWQEQHRILI